MSCRSPVSGLAEHRRAESGMYVDNLVTDVRHQARGYGGQLFGWLIRHATAEGCAELHLDSGVQRFDAHCFYLKHDMHIIAHHFSLGLDRQP